MKGSPWANQVLFLGNLNLDMGDIGQVVATGGKIPSLSCLVYHDPLK